MTPIGIQLLPVQMIPLPLSPGLKTWHQVYLPHVMFPILFPKVKVKDLRLILKALDVNSVYYQNGVQAVNAAPRFI